MPDVIMPQMGESIVEGTVTKWFKKVGDRVARDEPLFEISTDKVDTEIPAPAGGVLAEILVEEGRTVQVNTVVARIDDSGAGAAVKTEAPARPVAPPVVAPPAALMVAPPPAETDVGPRSSPLVRRLAQEHGIDLRQVKGTGEGGRISKHDIEDYLARTKEAPAAAPAAAPTAAFPANPAALFGRYRIEKLSVMRQRIGEHMALSTHLAPHVSTIHQIDVTNVARLRDRVKEQFERQHGVRLTYLTFFIRAACAALKAFPTVNASLDGPNIVYHDEINIGIAVALDGGLIVPVIRSADQKNFVDVQRAVKDLADRARRKQLKPEETQCGTFSISNYGSFGSLLGTPAINQPQSAILGLGAIHKAPVVINDAIAIRSIAYLTLSFDHRLLDGAVADQFMSLLKAGIEDWGEEIV